MMDTADGVSIVDGQNARRGMSVASGTYVLSPAILQGTAINQIKVKRNGSSIKAYTNVQLLASVTDSTYTGTRYIGRRHPHTQQ